MAPIRKAKARRRSYTDPTLFQRAADRIQKGELTNNQAATLYGIPASTLWDKLHNRRPVVGKPGPRTILSEEEEKLLEDWLIQMARIGYTLTLSQLRDAVKCIIEEDNRPNTFKENRPGRKWTDLFFKRHPQILHKIPEHLGEKPARVDSAEIKAWFNNFWLFTEEEELLEILSDPTRLFNTDESGFPICVKTSRVLEMTTKDLYRVGDSSRSQISVLACCSAAGLYVPPMMVFPGQRFNYDPLEGAPEGSFFGRTHNGWIDSQVFHEWLANHYLPFLKESEMVFPVILFVDGRASHLNLETYKFCRDNSIVLYCLPSHSSYNIHPLNISVYGPLKASWRRQVQSYQLANQNEAVQKQTFSRVFSPAWKESATMENAVSGFRNAGLYPFDIGAATVPTRIPPVRKTKQLVRRRYTDATVPTRIPPVRRKTKQLVRRRYTNPTLILQATDRIEKGEITGNQAASRIPLVRKTKQLVRRRYTDPTLILRAADRIEKGEITENQAASLYGIPASTLWDKLHYRRPVIGKPGPRTILSEEEEKLLEDWLIQMTRIGYPLTQTQLRDAVKCIIEEDNRPNTFKENRPGRKWTDLFFKRHPRITHRVPAAHLKRKPAIEDSAEIKAWFNNFRLFAEEEELLEILGDPTRLFNTDESGFPICVKTGRVLEMTTKDVYRVGDSSRSRITVLACCSAAGLYVPPMMVFPGQPFNYDPLEGAPEGSFFGRTHNGWIDSQVFHEWLAKHYLPFLKESEMVFPVILFVDGRASNLNLETYKFCRDNDIVLYCLPNHNIHPLDLAVYGPLKASWRWQAQSYQLANPDKAVQKQNFSQVFSPAWKESATMENAVSGFKKAGLYPFNIAVDKRNVVTIESKS